MLMIYDVYSRNYSLLLHILGETSFEYNKIYKEKKHVELYIVAC